MLFLRFSYELNHKISGAITESTYEETIEALTENIERIVTHKYFDECDIAYKDFIVRTYQVVRGHLKYMDDKFRDGVKSLYMQKIIDSSIKLFLTICEEFKEDWRQWKNINFA